MKTHLPADVCPYRRTPEFTQSTVPAALLRHHTTKPGGWAVIHALEGQLEYRILQPADERHLLTSDQPGLVEPTVPHEVVPLGQVRCYVEFHARGRVRRRRSARLILPHFRRVSSGVADGESWSIRMACVSTQSGFSERSNPHETNDFWWSLVWALSLTPAFAADAGHEHPHDAPPAKLQLDAGKKWQTDATLRQSMAELRQLFASKLPAIHANRLPASGYHALAKQVESGVSRIVARCKLPPAADAQLHIIVAELMSGAELMVSPADAASARKGAVKVIEALNQYGEYFNDPGFNKLSH